ncbi:MAG TPA: hypothetical protein GXX70_06505 [Tepidimicrobium sp.]|nr:hypothetical protein [Tepidimicrobium sp.]
MDLKELLGEELFKQVEEKLGDKKIDIVNDGRWIPKDKFDTVNTEKNEYKEQIDDLNEELGKLKNKVKDNDDVTEKIEDLEKEIENKEKEMKKLRKTNAIKFEVLKANPRDVNDILPHIDSEVVKIEDDEIVGLKEQIEKLKEEKAYLFKEDMPPGTGGSKGNPPRKGIETKVENLKDALSQHYKES